MKEFHLIFVTGVFGFIDVLIKFLGQQVKGQGHSKRKHNYRQQPVKFNLVTCCVFIFASGLFVVFRSWHDRSMETRQLQPNTNYTQFRRSTGKISLK